MTEHLINQPGNQERSLQERSPSASTLSGALNISNTSKSKIYIYAGSFRAWLEDQRVRKDGTGDIATIACGLVNHLDPDGRSFSDCVDIVFVMSSYCEYDQGRERYKFDLLFWAYIEWILLTRQPIDIYAVISSRYNIPRHNIKELLLSTMYSSFTDTANLVAKIKRIIEAVTPVSSKGEYNSES